MPMTEGNNAERDAGSTGQLARFALDMRFEDLPATTVAATRRLILDTTGCALAGMATESGQLLAQLKLAQGGTPESTLYASGAKLPVASAAYVLAQAANALDADECLYNR